MMMVGAELLLPLVVSVSCRFRIDRHGGAVLLAGAVRTVAAAGWMQQEGHRCQRGTGGAGCHRRPMRGISPDCLEIVWLLGWSIYCCIIVL